MGGFVYIDEPLNLSLCFQLCTFLFGQCTDGCAIGLAAKPAVEAAAAKCHVHGPGDVHMEEIPIVAGAFVGNGRQGVHSQKNQPVACVCCLE